MKDIWISLSGAIAQQQQIDTIANNVANVNTPGFKRDQMVFKEYLTALNKTPEGVDLPNKEWSPKDFYHSDGAELGFVKPDGSYTVFKQGQLAPTGNPLDLGIFGEGFFEVLTPNGIRYTRKGTFSLSKDGELVTEQGYKVLSKVNTDTNLEAKNVDGIGSLTQNGKNDSAGIEGKKGEEGGKAEEKKDSGDYSNRTLSLGNTQGRISINQQGEVFVSGKSIGAVSVVEFKDMYALKKEGDSFYINGDEKNIVRDDMKAVVHQGLLESSNVEAITELSSLLKANRQFESIQRALKTYDNIAGRGVNDIAKF